jgi:uncharacterized membrane protein
MDSVLAIILAILLSIAPVSELRGGIPFLVAHGMSITGAAIICIFFNILIIVPIFLFLDYIHKHFIKWNFYLRIFNFLIKPSRKRSKRVERAIHSYGLIALTLFVSLPLPITGAWTGSIVAWLLNLNRTKSFFAIALGVIIAGIVVSLVTVGVISFFGLI